MNTKIRRIALNKLEAHPDNPNRMSRATLDKLVRNIERTGRYEPVIVRPHPELHGCFQIINGHHRCHALRRLGHDAADAVVWDVDDEQADILLMTLNRLSGRDMLGKKLDLLRRLRLRQSTRDLSKLLPQTRGQLERLIASRPLPPVRSKAADEFAIPMVFFVNAAQQQTIEQALETTPAATEGTTRAARRAAALTDVARLFLDHTTSEAKE
jgi:hypothetical protein